MEKAYLGIGTNLGDRIDNLRKTVDAVNLLPLTKVLSTSKIYETTPVGYMNQGDFLNMVIEIETELSAENLLGACLGIEAGLGRVRSIKNGPRIVDVDLLLYGDEVRDTKTLVLPHPRMFEREFVLRPLLDIQFSNKFVDREKILSELTGEGIRDYGEKL